MHRQRTTASHHFASFRVLCFIASSYFLSYSVIFQIVSCLLRAIKRMGFFRNVGHCVLPFPQAELLRGNVAERPPDRGQEPRLVQIGQVHTA